MIRPHFACHPPDFRCPAAPSAPLRITLTPGRRGGNPVPASSLEQVGRQREKLSDRPATAPSSRPRAAPPPPGPSPRCSCTASRPGPASLTTRAPVMSWLLSLARCHRVQRDRQDDGQHQGHDEAPGPLLASGRPALQAAKANPARAPRMMLHDFTSSPGRARHSGASGHFHRAPHPGRQQSGTGPDRQDSEAYRPASTRAGSRWYFSGTPNMAASCSRSTSRSQPGHSGERA
jgi:hypothetical protein